MLFKLATSTPRDPFTAMFPKERKKNEKSHWKYPLRLFKYWKFELFVLIILFTKEINLPQIYVNEMIFSV